MPLDQTYLLLEVNLIAFTFGKDTSNKIIRKSVLLIGSFFLVLILFILYYWIFIEIPNHPPEPVASGIFPSQPVWVFEAQDRITATPTVL
jgi:hypothetical protein